MSSISKRQLPESSEMSDSDAIRHSRRKYTRLEGTKGTAAADLFEHDLDEDKPQNDNCGEYKSKHTLDSDEEEDIKYTKLDIDKVEGQEEAGIEFEGNTKITAFNMKEDLEDGHFDTNGTFIFNKKERDIKDAWLDNIDWAHIKKRAGSNWNKTDEDDNDAAVKTMDDDELKNVYEKLLSLLQPNENIEKALKRLGKQKLPLFKRCDIAVSAAEERKRRWAAKREGKTYEDESALSVKELTGLADSLVSKGEMEAYQYTKEKLQLFINQLENKAVDEVDMFSDNNQSTSSPSHSNKDSSSVGKSEVKNDAGDVVKWEYKLSEKEDAEIHGPFSSGEMLKMQEEGKFEDGGWARKYGTKTFYTVARLDFDIYT
ncbi:unnamed protein product [Anisakis simplex]|uniref:CD2 antigen cytoplasmic tail-binding protein 2 (inferred by orthology to a human protein) n=1 Tax=Anisakis simplex TaxID=6269 RepID=A0A0M3JV99_ANISI|nr:unnamed protein product [Anisakis simplex]